MMSPGSMHTLISFLPIIPFHLLIGNPRPAIILKPGMIVKSRLHLKLVHEARDLRLKITSKTKIARERGFRRFQI